mgnify:CR=1 FL=1
MFDYWSLSSDLQKTVASLVPTKSTWTLNLTKTNHDVWVFTIPWIKDEALCGGTEKVIDTYYKKLVGNKPEEGDKIQMTVSTTSSDDYTTKLIDPVPNSDGFTSGTVYTDATTQMECWLCPVLQVMFGEHVPTKLFVTFTLI